jgi:hypothetical protein
MQYKEFLKVKERVALPVGFECDDLNPMLKPIQHQVTKFSLRVGRASIFADTGQGKTPMQAVWCEKMNQYTNKPVLIMTPLAVAKQTSGECEKFHITSNVNVCREASDIGNGINIINIERVHKLEGIDFGAVCIDESSCLKSIDGKYKNMILDRFAKTPYRLACTATPAPNDQMELGNHAEYCGWSSRSEMLSMYFTHDGGETSKWRLRGHAKQDYYRWIASWSVMYRKPSDLGFSDDGYELPPLNIKEHVVNTKAGNGLLFSIEAKTLGEQRQARRDTISSRVELLSDLVNNGEPWVVWCNLNDESDAAAKAIPDYVCTFRKPGKNNDPIQGEFDHFAGDQSTFRNDGKLSIDIWQRYASPVWMDINPSNTLQFRSARADEDERHICPLQLDVIERCLQLWSMPDDIVLSPFAGIGSECYQAVKMGRKAIGCELKESYYTVACKNMNIAENEFAESHRTLFCD